MISSKTSSSWVTSCRLVPVTTIDNGTLRPSVNKCLLVPFFPLSVGLRPTASRAKGAFTRAPSMLCQLQEMPSISSYSARPERQRATKNPVRIHRIKCVCIALGLPNRSFGKAFHWQPVRKTYKIASKILRGGIGFLPPPVLRLYALLGSRSTDGIKCSTFSQKASETSHD